MSEKRSNNELSDLKIEIKKWEKQFYQKEGRKAIKTDIDGDEKIRSAYKRYWFLVKLQSRSDENKVAPKKHGKQPLREVSAKNQSQNHFARKLMKHFVAENIENKSGFSLKKKPKPSLTEDITNKENNEKVIDVSFVEFQETAVIKDSLQEEIRNIVEETETWSLPEEAEVVTDAEFIHVDVDTLNSLDINSNLVTPQATGDKQLFESFKGNDLADGVVNEISCDSTDCTKSVDETVTSILNSIVCGSNDTKDSDYCTFESDGVDSKKHFDSNDSKDSDYCAFERDSLDSKKNFDIYDFTDDEEDEEERIEAATRKRKRGKNNIDDDYHPVKKSKKYCEKKSVDQESKPKPKRNKSSSKANYQKLNLKKKVYASRGYKKFNSKRYKYSKWKKMKRNRCFKCGEADHWAQDCPMKDIIDEMNAEDLNLKKFNTTDHNEEDAPLLFIPAKPIFDENTDCNEVLTDALFALGFKTFKKNQQQTIKRICCGQSTILVSSTGSGKSLCYQIPAYLYWKHKKYVTLVVSPLISLMEDQLACLPRCLKAVSIHSGLKPHERQEKLSLVQQGNAQIIFLSPEMVGNNFFDFSLLPSIGFACIDEAHCLSEWSNNFRPSYLQLYKVMKEKLKIKTFLALTATATKETISQITKNLELTNEAVIGDTTVPKNLNLSVSRDVDKDHALIELLKSDRFINKNSIIVYCTRREVTEKIATLIRIEMQTVKFETASGSVTTYDARAYHAGLMSDERLRIQKRFLKGDLRVVVATIAFGMGINKSDVEGIIHYNLPRSFESYVQEIGRAGRNGSQAECHLFLDSNGSDLFELRKHIFANSMDKRVLRKLLEKVFKQCKCNQINSGIGESCGKRCDGHEVAFKVKETVLELDITQETILTLLCFLQLNYKKFVVELLPHINSMCKILCYKDGGRQMDAVAKKCPPLSVALTLHKKQNKLSETPSMFTFPFVEVASMLGQPSSAVRKQLRQCEWQTVNERVQRTNVRVNFEGLSFHLKAPGDLSDSEFEEVLDFLHDYVTTQEKKELTKLLNVYETFREFSVNKISKNEDSTKSEKLKEVVNAYFMDKDECDENLTDSQLQKWLGTSDSRRSVVHSLLTVDNSDIEDARCDIKDLINIHSDQQFTPRSIARILQGIGSPKFPVDVWSKVRRFWRTYIKVDFNTLLNIASEELIRLQTNF